ncbi:MAG: sulfite exporter TauE/SafE family protein [Kiritimatiellia bacterium]
MDWTAWIIPDVITVSPALYLAAVVTAVLLTGFSKGGFGGGLGVLATPLLMLVLPANVALAMMLPLLIVCDIFTLRHFSGDWDRRSFRNIAGGTTIGLLIGTALLVFFGRPDVNGDRWLKLIVGCVAIAFCLLKAWRAWRPTAGVSHPPGVAASGVIGIACGISTMLAHAAGQMVSIYFLSQRLDRRVFVGTTARYYLTFNSAKIPLFFLAGFLSQKSYITFETLKWELWLIPVCALGVAAGAWLNRRMSGTVFTVIVYALLFVTGVQMLVKVWRG